jgi:choline-sulfatase
VAQHPNFLIVMVDELRYPPVYESAELRAWVRENTPGQQAIRAHSLDFRRHYAASTACAPSRGSFYTGHYPSLHGVSQTTGAAKQSFDPDVFWLDPNTVPTLGDYFRAGGYETYYHGKWHITDADIMVPGTHNPLMTNDDDGTPLPRNVAYYAAAERLEEFGFSGWIGPEPHGSAKANCARVRDPGFARQAVDTLTRLGQRAREARDRGEQAPPWLLVSSFVNPHDIVLFGLLYKSWGFPFTEGYVPSIPEPPTREEDLGSKPRCQQSYVDVYPRMLLPQPTLEIYRQFYYYLQKEVDAHVNTVYGALRDNGLLDDTIVVFTSDHGELLGAHGGMHQKWHNAYEETIHVPFVLSNPKLFRSTQELDLLTSHIDVLPTLLGLAGIDAEQARASLAESHCEAQPLVGRDLSRVVLGQAPPATAAAPLYFLTYDQVSSGLADQSQVGVSYHPVIEPNNIETVIAELDTGHGRRLFKLSRYFDNPQFWSNSAGGRNTPPSDAETFTRAMFGPPLPSGAPASVAPAGVTLTRSERVADELEMYDVTADPLETRNLAHPDHANDETRSLQAQLEALLLAQCQQKRLQPQSGTVPGALSCQDI